MQQEQHCANKGRDSHFLHHDASRALCGRGVRRAAQSGAACSESLHRRHCRTAHGQDLPPPQPVVKRRLARTRQTTAAHLFRTNKTGSDYSSTKSFLVQLFAEKRQSCLLFGRLAATCACQCLHLVKQGRSSVSKPRCIVFSKRDDHLVRDPLLGRARLLARSHVRAMYLVMLTPTWDRSDPRTPAPYPDQRPHLGTPPPSDHGLPLTPDPS